jgi:VRR-NUC domain
MNKIQGIDLGTVARDGNREAREQAAIVDWIRTVAPDLLVFHPANGGWRSKAEAARFKWLGVVAGVPDLVLVGRDGVVRFIEVKADGGSLSRAQRDMRDRLTAMRVPYAVARSIDDVRVAFRAWGIETREVSQ